MVIVYASMTQPVMAIARFIAKMRLDGFKLENIEWGTDTATMTFVPGTHLRLVK